ncbi:hypothetical protein R83H12_01141 [Fibrobacteria bacterium R8-3-H12]
MLGLKTSLGYGHPFDLQELKNLPKAINEPVMIFESTKRDGSKVILLELQHKGRGRNNELINDIRSIYPKDNVCGVLDWINSKDNLLVWADKKKALNFISTQSTNLIASGNEIQGSTHNIEKNEPTP